MNQNDRPAFLLLAGMEMVCEKPLPIAAAREGDAAAWEILFKRFQLPIFAYLIDIIGPNEAGTCLKIENS